MTSRTTISQLAAGHRHKRTFRSLNDLEIADHEAGIERDRAEGLQPLVRIVHQLDAYLRDFHGRPPCRGLFSSAGKAPVLPRRIRNLYEFRREPAIRLSNRALGTSLGHPDVAHAGRTEPAGKRKRLATTSTEAEARRSASAHQGPQDGQT